MATTRPISHFPRTVPLPIFLRQFIAVSPANSLWPTTHSRRVVRTDRPKATHQEPRHPFAWPANQAEKVRPLPVFRFVPRQVIVKQASGIGNSRKSSIMAVQSMTTPENPSGNETIQSPHGSLIISHERAFP
jgi:hypothetical protein